MKKGYGKKVSAIVIGAILISAIGASQAFAWGSATHAYIDDRIGKMGPVRNLNEMYGGMATDVFNYLFVNLDWLNYLYLETHYDHNLVLWKRADTILEKATAFGFVSHNGLTGADATAHGTYDYDAPDAYVIAKAVEMAYRGDVYPYLVYFNLVDAEGVVLEAGYELCHNFVESAGDLLVAREDRSLGGKISAAALLRTPEFPDLLVKAYAKGFAKKFNLNQATAVKTIRTAENEFRRNLVSYGVALAQESDIAQGLIAEQLAALAPAFLGAYGITLPPGVDLLGLSNYLIGIALDVCEGDYLPAVEGTIPFVSNNLANAGITY
jgi:hypothetical protein